MLCICFLVEKNDRFLLVTTGNDGHKIATSRSALWETRTEANIIIIWHRRGSKKYKLIPLVLRGGELVLGCARGECSKSEERAPGRSSPVTLHLWAALGADDWLGCATEMRSSSLHSSPDSFFFHLTQAAASAFTPKFSPMGQGHAAKQSNAHISLKQSVNPNLCGYALWVSRKSLWCVCNLFVLSMCNRCVVFCVSTTDIALNADWCHFSKLIWVLGIWRPKESGLAKYLC